jgi:pimeloyl-ACP methyl ester carboxylesterase
MSITVQRPPEGTTDSLFHSYVGAGQRTSVHEDDVMGDQFAIAVATERGNTALAEKLRRSGPPPYSGSTLALKYLAYINVLNSYAFEHTPRRERTGHDLMSDAVKGSEYGLLDKVNWFRGLLEGFTVVYPQLETVDFAIQAPTLDVPMYFLQGRYDMLEIGSLLERWFAVLRAPRKEIIYFEQSGHTPHSFEPGKVVDVLAEHVLPQTSVPGLPAATRGYRSDRERRDDR